MTASHLTGPLVVFGQAPVGLEYNSDRGPSLFDQGLGLMDPRSPFAYGPGGQSNQAIYGWLGVTNMPVVDAVPSAISAVNLAALQVPVAATPLTLAAGTGITSAVSITNSLTGATVTGLRAIDTAMTGLAFGAGPDGNGGPVRIWDPTKAISRNIRITSVGNDSTATFAVAGYDVYGYPMNETITGANAGVASGAKAFKYIASITPAGTLSGSNISVGTGDVFGFPLRTDTFGYPSITWNNAKITANTGFVAAVTTTATATTGDVRGTYGVQSASDGTKRLQIFATLSAANISSTTGLVGVAQF